MSLSFPPSPTVGQIYQGWQWNGAAWVTAPAGLGTGTPVVLGIQVFKTAGAATYTPHAGMATCLVECVGGGGGAGGSTANTSYCYGAGGGGAGGYSRRLLTAAQVGASQPITVGAGGTGGAPGGGGTGGATSFGTLVIANGGIGSQNAQVGALSVGALGGDIPGAVGDVTVPGGSGTNPSAYWPAVTTSDFAGGTGGASVFGTGGSGGFPVSGAAANGRPGMAPGSGGGGGQTNLGSTNAAGGAGAPGIVIVTEYAPNTGLTGAQGTAGSNGLGYNASSSTSLTTATGTQTLTLSPVMTAYAIGSRIRVSSQGSTDWMEGVVTAYNTSTGSLSFTADTANGTGTHTDWAIGIAGVPGATAGVPSGSVMGFFQAAAPAGWTQVVTHNDKLLRVVNTAGGASGGSNPFSTVNAQTTVGNHTISAAELPVVTSYLPSAVSGYVWVAASANWGIGAFSGGSGYNTIYYGGASISNVNNLASINNGGGAHSHPLTMAIQYCDMILASKN